MKFGLKWVHMARYELILRLDGALWLTIISKAALTPKMCVCVKVRTPPSPAPPLRTCVNKLFRDGDLCFIFSETNSRHSKLTYSLCK